MLLVLFVIDSLGVVFDLQQREDSHRRVLRRFLTVQAGGRSFPIHTDGRVELHAVVLVRGGGRWAEACPYIRSWWHRVGHRGGSGGSDSTEEERVQFGISVV